MLAMLAIDARLYGSPLASGYGNADQFYAWPNVGPNAVRYLTWLAASQTPAVGLAALYFLDRRVRMASTVPLQPLLLGGTIVVVVASYLFYVPFDAWWYLRFLLPMWPVLMFLLASVIHAYAVKVFRAYAFVVLGASATNSGQLLTPMMLGLVGASVLIGQVMARIRLYRFLGTAGIALMLLGMWWLSQVTTST